jgi:PKD repeat protein
LGGDPTPHSPATYGTLFDQQINGHEYYTQTIWSNGTLNCEPAPPMNGTLNAGFTQSAQATTGAVVSFQPTITPSPNAVSSETFDFGDGSTPSFVPSGTAGFAHTYSHSGQYTAKLTVIDTAGNLYTVTHTVNVGQALTAAFSFSASTLVAGTAASFNGSSSTDPNSGATITTYAWNFGDGSHGTGVSASHTYTSAGHYTVTLTVTDSFGFTGTKSESVTVPPAPRITKISVKKSKGKHYLVVTVSGPGTVKVGSKSMTLHAAGKTEFKLSSKHTHVTVTIIYTPTGGTPQRKTVTVTVG